MLYIRLLMFIFKIKKQKKATKKYQIKKTTLGQLIKAEENNISAFFSHLLRPHQVIAPDCLSSSHLC